jgi:5'-methylthioadenosine/S-adenosylhomocysteine nucleosidase
VSSAGAGPEDLTLLLGAFDAEIEAFHRHLEGPRTATWRGYEFYEGRIAGRDVVVSRSGVGKTLSAMLTQHLTERYRPARILFTGVAGALNPELEIGDTVVARTCMQWDMDATAVGFELGEVPYSSYRVISCDAELVEAALTCTPSNGRVFAGHVLTGDSFIVTSTDESHRYLRESLGGDAVEMEGASVGLVAAVNEVPFLLLRTISDKADTSASVHFAKVVRQASRNAWEFVEHVLSQTAAST